MVIPERQNTCFAFPPTRPVNHCDRLQMHVIFDLLTCRLKIAKMMDANDKRGTYRCGRISWHLGGSASTLNSSGVLHEISIGITLQFSFATSRDVCAFRPQLLYYSVLRIREQLVCKYLITCRGGPFDIRAHWLQRPHDNHFIERALNHHLESVRQIFLSEF